jgi:PAS domain S-box-containing protein
MAASVPLLSKGRVVGALNVASCRRDAFSPEEKSILELIGKEAGTLLSKLQTEAALRASEKYYRTLIDTSPDIIAVTDLQGRLQMVNQSFVSLSGYYLDEIIGRNSLDFVAAFDQEAFRQNIEEFIKNRNLKVVEYGFKRRDGRIVPLELSASLLLDATGKPQALIGFGRDVSERQRAEEQIRFLSSITENTTDAIMVTDTDFHITYINKIAEKFFGYSLDELQGQTPGIFNVEPLAAEIQEKIYQTVSCGQTYLGESLNRRKDGSTFYCEYKVMPLKGADGRIHSYFSLQRDISERKHGEEVLRRSEETFRRTFEAIPDPAYIWKRQPDRRLLLTNANEAAERITKGGIRRFIGIEAEKLFGPDSAFVLSIRQVLDTGEVLRSTEVLYRYQSTGESKWLLVDYVPTAVDTVLVITKDVSEFKQAEAQRAAALDALRQSESKYRELVENHNDVIFSVDAAGVIGYISPAITAITGFAPEEVVGRNLFDFFSPEERVPYSAQMQQTALQGSSVGEFLITVKDGSRRWIRASSRSVAENGEVVGIRGIMSDISQRKEAEAQLLSYQEQLRALGTELTLVEERERRRIAAELHDQIGQNLALGKLKVAALEKGATARKLKSELSAVRRLLEVSIRDARSLIFDLSPPVLYELGFPAALEWLAERIGEQYGVPVDFEDRAPGMVLEGDRQVILFQVVRELLVNMGKHSKAGRAKVILANEEGALKIQVNDDGVGFDARQMLESRGRAGGYGLFSMSERLRSLGGRLEVRSMPGKGSQIILALPRAARPEAAGETNP